MVWELWMMIQPKSPTPGMLMAAFVASVFSGFLSIEREWLWLFMLVAPIIGALTIPSKTSERATFFLFCLGIQLAGFGLVVFRAEFSLTYLLWLVSIVVATDIFGYFSGRSLGGPKFWPAISPKKTWSGTIAGWIAAAIIGALFWQFTKAGPAVVWLSVLISFAGQMGDIAESALKRRMGVKDSSTLIPGHGGLFDRFDALLGASLFLLIVAYVFDVPGLRF
jgi:phosphatidate cytidylyltransferase